MSLHLKPTMSKSQTTNKRTTKPPRLDTGGLLPECVGDHSGLAPFESRSVAVDGPIWATCESVNAFLHKCFTFAESCGFQRARGDLLVRPVPLAARFADSPGHLQIMVCLP